MNIKEKINLLESEIKNPKEGLPEEIFLFISRNTPLINVDLLIKNNRNETLLVYRKDEFYNGWHIPGGIIRFKETIQERIQKTALNELGASVIFENEPLMVKELINKYRNDRGHFISMLFSCKLTGPLNEKLKCKDINNPINGEYYWFKKVPDNLLRVHELYRSFIEKVK